MNINDLIAEANILIAGRKCHGSTEFNVWYDHCIYVLSKKYGEDSLEYKQFIGIRWQNSIYVVGPGMQNQMIGDTISGLQQAIALFNMLVDEDDFAEKPNVLHVEKQNILIVYGHNDAVKQKIMRLVEKQGLNPIALNEKIVVGATIIEKFEKLSNCGAAICIFSADDIGKEKNEKEYNDRARQNVVFEAGYCIGKIGRDKVIIVADRNVEMPSDLDGVVYTDMSSFDLDLLKSLKQIGYKIDFNKAF